jgi:tRNA modification GTPase
MNAEDTIVAIATPSGRGGLGVVRLSGPQSAAIARKTLRCSSEIAKSLKAWRLRMAELVDESGVVIDRALVSYFAKPRSYTGEDIVEISCHGAPVVLRFVVERCLAAGARLAEPGEFTLRAFLNGRMDLAQAEAVRDLIEAQTLYQAKLAAQQIDGAVSHWIAPWKQQLVDLIALLEAGIDFAEDDVSVPAPEELAAKLGPVEAGLAEIAASFRLGKILHDGLTLAIVGRPNVGKSSLFNALLQKDRAIVTSAPGTTRDLVAETVEIEGIPLRFVDTAGVREAFDEAEAIGVRKSLEAAAESDLAVLVLDGSAALAAEDVGLIERLMALDKLLLVVNKSDLPARFSEAELKASLGHGALSRDKAPPIVSVSALRQEGIARLRDVILEAALPALSGGREMQYLTNLRHEGLVNQAVAALQAARSAVPQNLPHEMLLLDLYNALHALDAITGETTVEDILTQIFSTFCIGK